MAYDKQSEETQLNNYLYLALAFAIGFAFGSNRLRDYFSRFQNRGEAEVSSEIQANFSAPDYHLLNHVTLKLKDGTTQIDHILVSRFGVFVIETKDFGGWIFGDPKQANWTQVLYRLRFKFQNPIFQNYRHVQAVRELLDFLPIDAVKSLVVFTNRAEFKTELPSNVISLTHLINYLKQFTDEVITTNRLQFSVGRIETSRLALSGETDLQHLENLRNRKYGRRTR